MPAKKTPKNAPRVEPPAAAIATPPAAPADNLALLEEVEVTLAIELGRHTFTLDEALACGEQSLIELDKNVGDPVDVLINGKLFARGEVVTVSENFGIRLTEIVGQV
jgi:flagellar motor switch protein FliN/FliY